MFILNMKELSVFSGYIQNAFQNLRQIIQAFLLLKLKKPSFFNRYIPNVFQGLKQTDIDIFFLKLEEPLVFNGYTYTKCILEAKTKSL